MCCDSQSAISLSERLGRRVRPSSKCADILRSIRSSKNRMKAHLSYEHVDGHMDWYLLWHQMTLQQQLNCICNGLAKSAVARAIRLGMRRESKQLLSREDVAVYINGQKATSDFAEQVRYGLSKEHAKHFLRSKMGWGEQQFEEVDWEWLYKTLDKKPDGYKIWLSKQHTGFCGLQV